MWDCETDTARVSESSCANAKDSAIASMIRNHKVRMVLKTLQREFDRQRARSCERPWIELDSGRRYIGCSRHSQDHSYTESGGIDHFLRLSACICDHVRYAACLRLLCSRGRLRSLD